MSALAGLLRLTGLALLGWLAVVVELAPLRLSLGETFAAPDMLFCVFAALALRRPSAAPSPLVFALGLARDLVSGGPVGPGALGLTLSIEALRSSALQRQAPLVRWVVASIVFGFGLALSALLLLASLSSAPPIDALASRFGATALLFPAAALLTWLILRAPERRGLRTEGGL